MKNTLEDLDKRLVLFHIKWWIPFLVILFLSVAALFWAIFTKIPIALKSESIYLNDKGFEFVKSQIDGEITWKKSVGEQVKGGDIIAFVNDTEGKKEWKALAQNPGKIFEVLRSDQEWVFKRETLALIQRTEGSFHFYTFLPFKSAPYVKEGMEVYLKLYGEQKSPLKGKIHSISLFLISNDRLKDLLGNDSLIHFLTHGEPVVEVQILAEQGISIAPATQAHTSIIISSRRIISYLIPRGRH